MSSILERNLEALLGRAYEPARMRAPFREALREAWLARVASPRRASGPRRRALPRVAAVFLAVLSLGAAAALWRAMRTAPDLASILAAGDVAWHADPTDRWSRLGADERARGFAFEPPFLELATPEASGVRVALADGSVELRATPSARLLIEGRDDEVRVDLRAGGLTVRGGAEGAERRFVTSEGTVLHASGALALAYVSPEATVALASELAGLAVDRPLVRIRAEGSTRLAATGAEVRGEHYLQGGALLGPTRPDFQSSGGGDSTGDREALPAATASGSTVAGASDASGKSDASDAKVDFAGRVVDAETGDPLAKFRVWVLRSIDLPKVAEPHVFDFDSLQDGVFEVAGVPDGEFRVFVEAAGFAVWKQDLTLPRPEGADALEVRLALGSSARGYVTDAATGAPIAGALVLAEVDIPYQILGFEGPTGAMPLASATTDANGAYTFEHVSPDRHLFRVSAAGYAPRWTPFVEVGGEQPCDVPRVELTPGGRIFGFVEREDGSAWVGANIVASVFVMNRPNVCMTFGFATTGPDGRYTIDHAPAGHYVLLNTTAQPNAAPEWNSVQQASMPEEGELEVNFLGPVSRTRVTGTLATAGGEPVDGLSITLTPDPYSSGYADWKATPAGPDGAYELTDVAPGLYGVFVSARLSKDMTLVRVVAVPDEPEFRLDLTLPRTKISGTLSTAGEASQSAAVTVVAVREDGTPRGVTYFAGKMEVARPGDYAFPWLDPGVYTLYAADEKGELFADHSDPLELAPGEALVHDFEFRPGGNMRITVVDSGGAPLADASLRFVDDRGATLPLAPETATDEKGVLESAAVRPGTWTVIADKAGYGRAETQVVVLEGETVERTIALQLR